MRRRRRVGSCAASCRPRRSTANSFQAVRSVALTTVYPKLRTGIAVLLLVDGSGPSDLGDELGDDAVELVGVLELRPMPGAVDQQQPRVRDDRDEAQRMLVAHHPVVATMDEQSRGGDAGDLLQGGRALEDHQSGVETRDEVL